MLEEAAELAHQARRPPVSVVRKPSPPRRDRLVVVRDRELGERALVVVRHHLDEPRRARSSQSARTRVGDRRAGALARAPRRARGASRRPSSSSGSSSTSSRVAARRERRRPRRARRRCRRSCRRRSCGRSGRARRRGRRSCTRSRGRRRPRRRRCAPELRTAKRSPARPRKNALPAGRAVEDGVADDHVLLGARRPRRRAAARRARRRRGPCRRSRWRRRRASARRPGASQAPNDCPAEPCSVKRIVPGGRPVGAVALRDARARAGRRRCG